MTAPTAAALTPPAVVILTKAKRRDREDERQRGRHNLAKHPDSQQRRVDETKKMHVGARPYPYMCAQEDGWADCILSLQRTFDTRHMRDVASKGAPPRHDRHV